MTASRLKTERETELRGMGLSEEEVQAALKAFSANVDRVVREHAQKERFI